MKRVTIRKIPAVMKRGGYPNLFYQTAPWTLHDTSGVKPTEVNESVKRDDENPNIEAEGGETMFDPNVGGLPAHFNINGPSHAQGGVPMRATEDSFIFSKFLKMPKDVAEILGFPVDKKSRSNKTKYSFADAAKKYGGVINKSRETMADPLSTKLDISTAELNMKNAIDYLGKIAMYQEASKGFEDGIPQISMPYLMRVGANPEALMPMASPQEGEEGQEGVPQEQMEGMPEMQEMPEEPMAMYGGTRRRLRRAQEGMEMMPPEQAMQQPQPQQMQQAPPQGQPQQGGGDKMAQVVAQVQQLLQQGIDPQEIIAQLLSAQIPPEVVMQVLVQVGVPQEQAGPMIQEVMAQMQGGQGQQQMAPQQMAPQGPQEEMMEAPQDPMMEEGAEEMMMKYGGSMLMQVMARGGRRRRNRYADRIADLQARGRYYNNRSTYSYDTPTRTTTGPSTTTTTVVKFAPPEGAIVIKPNANESEEAFSTRLKEEYKKSTNKSLVYVQRPDGKFQKVTAANVSKVIPKATTVDPRLGDFNDMYSYVESVVRDPANDKIMDRVYEEYKKKVNASPKIDAARKRTLLAMKKEDVINNFLKAQQHVFAIANAEKQGLKVDNLDIKLKDDLTWDKPNTMRKQNVGSYTKPNDRYKAVMKAMGYSDADIMSTEQISAFQAAYRGFQEAADDPEFAKVLTQFDLKPRGREDDLDERGRPISPVDDVWGNTTAGQGLFVKGTEEGLSLEDMVDQDKTTTTPGDVIPGKGEYTMPDVDYQYFTPDVNNLLTAGIIGSNQANIMPGNFKIPYRNPEVAYLDPSREITELKSAAMAPLTASSLYGAPQQFAALNASTQAGLAPQVANVASKYFNANNEIFDRHQAQKLDYNTKMDMFNTQADKQRYDEFAAYADNNKTQQNNWLAQMNQLNNTMHVNAATSANLESMSGDRYRIDEPSGLVYFNKGKMPDGQQQYDDYEAMMDRMDELVNRGVSKDKAAQLVFGTKGMGESDPNAQYVQMLNQLMQNSAYNPNAYASNNQQPQMSQEEMAMLMQMMGAQG